jgi:hypothetical protein
MTERPLDVSTCLSMWKNNFLPAVGVLDEPYSAKPARVAIPVPAYVDWPLAGLYGYCIERG